VPASLEEQLAISETHEQLLKYAAIEILTRIQQRIMIVIVISYNFSAFATVGMVPEAFCFVLFMRL